MVTTKNNKHIYNKNCNIKKYYHLEMKTSKKNDNTEKLYNILLSVKLLFHAKERLSTISEGGGVAGTGANAMIVDVQWFYLHTSEVIIFKCFIIYVIILLYFTFYQFTPILFSLKCETSKMSRGFSQKNNSLINPVYPIPTYIGGSSFKRKFVSI